LKGIEEIIFDEGMKMMTQISQENFILGEIRQNAKNWPVTIDHVNKFFNPNDHSEPTLADTNNPNQSASSHRFLTNKSLERKNKNLKGMFTKSGEEGRQSQKVEKISKFNQRMRNRMPVHKDQNSKFQSILIQSRILEGQRKRNHWGS
jgi:hypothetical protein